MKRPRQIGIDTEFSVMSARSAQCTRQRRWRKGQGSMEDQQSEGPTTCAERPTAWFKANKVDACNRYAYDIKTKAYLIQHKIASDLVHNLMRTSKSKLTAVGCLPTETHGSADPQRHRDSREAVAELCWICAVR